MSLRHSKKLFGLIRHTPFHPQWLLGKDDANQGLLEYAKGKVLDIGCADRWPEQLLPNNCQYLALDYPATGDQLYRSRPDVFADAASLPFVAGTFDTILLFEVLEHLERPQQALAEIARVLKPGGILVLSVPFLYPMHDEPHDYQRYTFYGLTREIEAVGLHIENISGSLGTASTGGLIMNLALGGMALQAIRLRRPAALLVPILLMAIPFINVCAWVLDKILPSWPAITGGYTAVSKKL